MNNVERFTKAINWEPVDRILTYDFDDSEPLLVECGGYDPSRSHTWDEVLATNARAWKTAGLNVTRYVYDPQSHWMGGKIVNWIRFFGVDPANWEIGQAGGTAWISKRPFKTLAELEKHMPKMPVYEDVRSWYEPWIKETQATLAEQDIVFIGAVEGPITDAYSYMDMQLFCEAIYQAPELVAHIMDCCGTFSAYIARTYAEVGTVPLLFMGEDIATTTGPIFKPDWVRREGLPRWRWIADPIHAAGMKFLYHTDGRYGSFLPLIFDELGADGLNPIERNGCNDIFAIRAAYPHKLLFGNVCCAQTLPNGSAGDVEDETLELIEKIGPQGGIFIGSSSEVHDLVPVENAVTMYQTVQRYGHYPIDVDQIRGRRKALREAGALNLRALLPL
ncbi:MAG TPA: uroporphyrinogen decarboxylase family protein [Anaerolineae bacterium]